LRSDEKGRSNQSQQQKDRYWVTGSFQDNSIVACDFHLAKRKSAEMLIGKPGVQGKADFNTDEQKTIATSTACIRLGTWNCS